MPRRLDISIHSDGTVTAEASGTPGPDCLDALEQLRQMLQAHVEGSKPTPEFSMTPVAINDEQWNGNDLEDRA